MKLAIMQPYLFPYIGYFQMVNAVDKFVFYDDVNFIKGGWINRNRILAADKPLYINVLLNGASPYKLIKDITVNVKRINKTIKTISQYYSKAPFYNEVIDLINNILLNIKTGDYISKIAGQSIIEVSRFLNIETTFEYSSEHYDDSKGMEKAERLIEICKRNNADTYINAYGGIELYSKDYFNKKGINLFFIQSQSIEYKQFNNEFIPFLSIIDVLMFNSKEKTQDYLNKYELK